MAGWKVAAIGQCCLDRLGVIDAFPELDEKVEVVHWEEQIGGPAATALVALSRLGISTSLYSVTGDDPEGEQLRILLQREGIDCSSMVTREGSRSQTAFIAVEKKTGSRTIFWRRAGGEPLSFGELPAGFPVGFDFLHLDGLMGDVSIEAARHARERGIPVLLDAGRIRNRTLELARLCDYVIGSEVFAQQIGWGTPDFPKHLLQLEVEVVVLTFGERGCHTFAGDQSFATPAFAVEVVDTTGAGDVFHGAFLYGLLQKWEIQRVVRFASAAAAIKCKRLGGSAGAPSLAEIHEFLKSV